MGHANPDDAFDMAPGPTIDGGGLGGAGTPVSSSPLSPMSSVGSFVAKKASGDGDDHGAHDLTAPLAARAAASCTPRERRAIRARSARDQGALEPDLGLMAF